MTLSREVMGLFCLSVLWTTALLVAGAAFQDVRDLRARLRRVKRAIRGVAEGADGAPFASWTVEQRGRALDGARDAIAFHDRAFVSTVHGGRVRAGGRTYRVEGPGEVWLSPAERARALAASAPVPFEAAYAQAVRAAGFVREVRAAVGDGQSVLVLGDADGDRVHGGEEGLVVATFDPSSSLVREIALAVGFVAVELAAVGAVTWLCLSVPHFGPRSVVGALLGLGFFLGVTPVAVAVRERGRAPSEAWVRGVWKRPAPGA